MTPRRYAGLCGLLTGIPVAFLIPLFVGRPFGPAFHFSAGSARYLDLWAVLSILTAILLAGPAAWLAHKWRGPVASGVVLAFLSLVAAVACRIGIWWT